MDERDNVLILCTRNSARSQMAEGLLKAKAVDRFNIYSAGLKPDRVHPMVPVVMDEIGIDVSGQSSKDVRQYLGRMTAHYLIIVCENAEENCPRLFPGVGQRLFWPFDDPAAVETSEEEQLSAFRRIRDEISERLDGCSPRSPDCAVLFGRSLLALSPGKRLKSTAASHAPLLACNFFTRVRSRHSRTVSQLRICE